MSILIFIGPLFILLGIFTLIKPESAWFMTKGRLLFSGIEVKEAELKPGFYSLVGFGAFFVIFIGMFFTVLGISTFQYELSKARLDQFADNIKITANEEEDVLIFENTSSEDINLSLENCSISSFNPIDFEPGYLNIDLEISAKSGTTFDGEAEGELIPTLVISECYGSEGEIPCPEGRKKYNLYCPNGTIQQGEKNFRIDNEGYVFEVF